MIRAKVLHSYLEGTVLTSNQKLINNISKRGFQWITYLVLKVPDPQFHDVRVSINRLKCPYLTMEAFLSTYILVLEIHESECITFPIRKMFDTEIVAKGSKCSCVQQK